MINEERYDEIERYLDGAMSPSEKQAFELRMHEDASLKKVVHSLQTTRDFLQYTALAKEKIAIQKGSENYFRAILIKRVSLVAAIVACALVLWWLVPSNKEISSGTIDTSHIKTPTLTQNIENTTTPKEIITQNNSVKESVKGSTNVEEKITPKEDKSIPANVSDNPLNKADKANVSAERRDEKNIVDSVHYCAYTLKPIIETTASCENKNTGGIKVMSINYAKLQLQAANTYDKPKEPYLYRLEGGVYSSKSNFNFLHSGSYQLEVKDANGCVGKTEIEIEERDCPREINGIISYSQNSSWEIPSGGKTGALMIYNSGGALLVNVPVDDHSSTWNGYDNQSQRLKAGAYYYRVICDDKIVAQGSITILE